MYAAFLIYLLRLKYISALLWSYVVRRPSVRRLSLLTFHFFDFSSETTEGNSTKLDRKQDLKQDGRPGLYLAETVSTSLKLLNGIQRNLIGSKISMSSTKFVFFRADRKNKMAAPASHWLRLFDFHESWQEIKSQHPLPSLRFFFWLISKQKWPSVKKVAHCTQVHVMWPFGPLVFFFSNNLMSIGHFNQHNNMSFNVQMVHYLRYVILHILKQYF